jgi:hypothetical protein
MIYQAIIIEEKNISNLTNDSIQKILLDTLSIKTRINEFNTLIIEPIGLSIGIESTKKINNWIWSRSDEVKILIIKFAEKMTIQTQNAILKILEEPPQETAIVLAVSNSDMLLDTIRSRCLMIAGVGSSEKIDTPKAGEFIKLNFISRVKLIENITKEENSRESALKLIEELINYFIGTKSSLNMLESLKDVYIGIKAGSNIRAGLEYINIQLENL